MSYTNYGIAGVEATTESLTGRAGLAPFARYLETSGMVKRMSDDFADKKGSSKGTSVRDILASVMCWFANGESRHLTSFDDLKADDSVATVFGVEEVPSSHAVKRFFEGIIQVDEWKFRNIELELFISRLCSEKPKVIYLGLDSMVLDNDDAKKRAGVGPTYKKICGYHPLQLTWNGMIVDAQFRSGPRHCHEKKFTMQMLRRTVQSIRENYSTTVPIIIRLDAGFFDQTLFQFLDKELCVGFLCGGRIMTDLRDTLGVLDESAWGEYANGHQLWRYTEIGFRCASWNKFYRAVYTQAMSREDGQMLLDFARPDSLIITNLGMRSDLFSAEGYKEVKILMAPQKMVEVYHGRGAEELVHRGLKDFGFEQLPFKRYHGNMGLYHCMVISHGMFEFFKRDVLPTGMICLGAYATTVRRLVFDVAGKIIHHSNRIILKIRDCVMERLRFGLIWQKACEAEPLLL